MRLIIPALVLLLGLLIFLSLGGESGSNDPKLGASAEFSEPNGSSEDANLIEGDASIQPDQRDAARTSTATDFVSAAPSATEFVQEPLEAAWLTVRVVDEAGAPWSERAVRVRFIRQDEDGNQIGVDPTESADFRAIDRQGRAEFEVPSGRSLEIDVRGVDGELELQAQDRALPLERGERRELEVLLPREQELFFGRVVADETSVPIPGVQIQVGEVTPSGSSSNSTFETNPEGRFRIPLVSFEGEVAMTRAEGYGPKQFAVSRSALDPKSELVLRLPRSCAIRGTLLSGSSSNLTVVARASAWAIREAGVSGERFFPPTWSCLVDPSGRFELPNLPPSVSLTLDVYAEDEALALGLEELSLEPGETREVRIELGDPVDVEVSVFDSAGLVLSEQRIGLYARDDVPLPASISWYTEPSRSGITDMAGRVRFESVATGEWVVAPRAERQKDQPLASGVLFAVDGKSSPVLVEVRLEEGLFIRGTCYTPEGLVLHPGTVMASGQEGSFDAQTADDGTYEVGPLPRGLYSVRLVLLDAEPGLAAPPKPTQARAGDSNVDFAALAAGQVEISILNQDGEPVPNGVLDFSRRGEPGSLHRQTGPSPMRVLGLQPGAYDFSAQSPGGGIGVLQGVEVFADGSEESHIIDLQPAGRLRMNIESDAGSGRWATVHIFRGAGLVKRERLAVGTEALLEVPVGTLRLTVRVPGETGGPREVTVRTVAGQVTDLDVDFRR